jgi:hypothetical protein
MQVPWHLWWFVHTSRTHTEDGIIDCQAFYKRGLWDVSIVGALTILSMYEEMQTLFSPAWLTQPSQHPLLTPPNLKHVPLHPLSLHPQIISMHTTPNTVVTCLPDTAIAASSELTPPNPKHAHLSKKLRWLRTLFSPAWLTQPSQHPLSTHHQIPSTRITPDTVLTCLTDSAMAASSEPTRAKSGKVNRVSRSRKPSC